MEVSKKVGAYLGLKCTMSASGQILYEAEHVALISFHFILIAL